MSSQRFIQEFKEEAVRQIVERRCTVAEVAARVGVSTHSIYIYKWVKAVAPYNTEKQAADLIDARSEILRHYHVDDDRAKKRRFMAIVQNANEFWHRSIS